MCVLLMGFSTTFKETSLIVHASVRSIVLLPEFCVATEDAVAGRQIALCRCFRTIPVGESALNRVVSMSHYLSPLLRAPNAIVENKAERG